MSEAFIVAAVRTAGGRRGGLLSFYHPVDLAAEVLDALVARIGIDPAAVDDVIMGCVGQAGEQSTNVARNAILASSLPESVPGTSVDRQCGSSQQALHFAAATVMAGQMDLVIAAGVESMTRVPMGLPAKLPAEHGFGKATSPRMEARYPGIVFSQFEGAEMIARKYGLTRDDTDRFGFDSHRKAIAATNGGLFSDEIVPLTVQTDAGEFVHQVDEGIRFEVDLDAIRSVKLIAEGSIVTAATASQMCDGASGVLVASEAAVKRFGLVPLARVHQMTVIGEDPVIMLEAPINATRRALDRAGLGIGDVDLFEVNEAFAPIPLAWLKATGADPERLNVNGGAISLGHPLGASGTKLMATLIHELRRRGGRYGLQTMCEGGGLANVTIVEAL